MSGQSILTRQCITFPLKFVNAIERELLAHSPFLDDPEDANQNHHHNSFVTKYLWLFVLYNNFLCLPEYIQYKLSHYVNPFWKCSQLWVFVTLSTWAKQGPSPSAAEHYFNNNNINDCPCQWPCLLLSNFYCSVFFSANGAKFTAAAAPYSRDSKRRKFMHKISGKEVQRRAAVLVGNDLILPGT